ncbi:MAG TPA: hypothetical protein ENK09_02340 [Nitrospirae bacterium]|nr:hypothetical protein [Nitrospirota bacterium]
MKKYPEIDELIQAIVQGEAHLSVNLAEALIAKGLTIESIIQDGLTAALQSLNAKCTNEEFNLLEIVLAGRAMMAVMDNVIIRYLPPARATESVPEKTLVLGTIEGDIHELGKHVVKMLLRSSGYRVIDIGKDIRPEEFVERAIQQDAGYIGVSSLLTTTIPSIRRIKELLNKAGRPDIKVIAGGGAIQQTSRDDLNVDFVAQSAFDILNYLKNLQDEG